MMCFYVLLNTMTTLFPLKLYTTSACHLCDEAYTLLTQLNIEQQITLIEIADDDALLAEYGVRIPVLQRVDNDTELNWPFGKNEVLSFLSA